MKEHLDAYCYIQEQTSFQNDYNTPFGYKVHDRGSRFFITFDAVLQSFGVKNRNRRYYEAANVMNCINTDVQIQDALRHNSWLGEIDHPSTPYQGKELSLNRIGNPNPQLSSHYIRRPRLNGNLLEATIQTDSGTKHGMNMAIKIVDGKIIPCFSARILGRLQNKNGQPTVYVNKLITYDWVLFPSHQEAVAKINQPIVESTNELQKYIGRVVYFTDLARMAANNSKEVEFLCESFDLTIDDVIGVTENGSSVVVKEDNNYYVQPIRDRDIRNKTKKALTDWINR